MLAKPLRLHPGVVSMGEQSAAAASALHALEIAEKVVGEARPKPFSHIRKALCSMDWLHDHLGRIIF